MSERVKVMKRIRKVLLTCVMFVLMFTMASTPARAAVRLNKKTAVMTTGTKLKLKLKGTKKKVSWRSSNRKVAAVSKKGVVTAKKKGTVKIVARVNGKKYTCRLQVLDNEFLGLSSHEEAVMTGEGITFFIRRMSYAGTSMVCEGFFKNTTPVSVPAGTAYDITIKDGAGRVLAAGHFTTASELAAGGYLDVTLTFGPGALGQGTTDLRLVETADASVDMTIRQETVTERAQ